MVARVEEWPGVHCAHALLTGEPVQGTWHDRTLPAPPAPAQEPEPGQVDTQQTVVLSHPPLLEAPDTEKYRARIAGLIRRIEEATAAERAKKGVEPLGAEKILAQDPRLVPKPWTARQSPLSMPRQQKVRKELRDAYSWFEAAYKEAVDKLRKGDRSVAFPPGSFPPHLPFIPA